MDSDCVSEMRKMPTPDEISELVAYLRENPEASWNPLYDAIEESANDTRQDPFTNSIGMELVWIAPGRFMMGSPDSDEEAWDHEKPQHEVVLTRGYHLGKYPVTRGQFAEFVKATGHKAIKDWENPGFPQTDDHPVVNVSWDDAVAFCAWLSKKEECEYRLPTEAEWEYACRAGTTTSRYNGLGAEAVERIAWLDVNSGDATHSVGKLQSNEWGLFDMLGNVWEWCFDYLEDDYDMNKCIDTMGSTEDAHRAFRGGGWNSFARSCRSANRLWYYPTGATTYIGFRLARSSK